jgi:hypothetical protein
MTQGTIRNHRRALVCGMALALAAAMVIVSLGGSAGAAPSASTAKKKGGSGLNVVSKTFRLSTPDSAVRFETICPKGKFPYGGGMKSDPAPADGEGVYPNSYERLGVQHGYHINGTLVDVNGSSPAPRDVTVQAVCGSKPGKITPPHKTVFVQPDKTESLTMNCTGKRTLLGGGYQRTTGRSNHGDIITESRAVGTDAWTVTARGIGNFGGELTGIAYCIKSKKPIQKEVSATVPIGTNETATATTPGCPKGRRPSFGGFQTASDGSVMYFGGYFTTAGTWAATAFNSGPATTLTAYMYCLRPFNK